MPTAQSATIADLVRDLTTLRITALSAGDPAVQQAALDDAEVELYGLLGGSAFPPFADLTATGKAQVQRYTLKYAHFHLLERIGKMGDAERLDRERVDKQVEDFRARGAGLEALGDPAPSSPRASVISTPTTRTWSRTSMTGTWGGS